ncbi:acyl-CoA synthetase (AMP-forming)/AMP-acid ligase II [Amycolatopsis bartoniae]|nr:fatty acid--CoA ligase family protein [Amycolatopsis bartoniae]MBB2939663.1 acyl-CoA synthetase (AMP-forming)/AMP-acid ligase II [Amycolatopsis bartoniae]TVT06231.1 long-chain fatty acid--CoA ligase [Amycolatopsis bartoniae]
MDITQRFGELLTLGADTPAVGADGVWDTWGDIARLRGTLHDLLAEIPPEAAIGVICRNSPEVIEVFVALLAEHRVVFTLHDLQPDKALAEEIAEKRPAAVLATETDLLRPGVRESIESSGLVGIAVSRGGAARLGVRRRPAPGFAVLTGDVAVSLKSSGTTGPPKRIELSYPALSASIDAVERHHSKDGAPVRAALRSGVTIQMLSLAHTSALQTVCTTLAQGRRLVVLPRFEPVPWAKAVRENQVVTTGLPPAAVKMLLDSDVPADWLSSLKAVRAGSAPLPAEVAEQFEARFGVPVLRAYGATEFQGIASWTLKDHKAHGADKRGAVGRVHPGVEVRVVSPETGEAVPNGEQGVLEVRSAGREDKGWVRTSDLARVDDDGFLWIEGRVDGAINRGGFKIDPDEVAAALRTHPDVRDAAVVPADDPRLGQVPVAAVELSTKDKVTGEDLRGWVRERLEPFKVPAQVAVVDALPRTAAMKADRQAILALLGR